MSVSTYFYARIRFLETNFPVCRQERFLNQGLNTCGQNSCLIHYHEVFESCDSTQNGCWCCTATCSAWSWRVYGVIAGVICKSSQIFDNRPHYILYILWTLFWHSDPGSTENYKSKEEVQGEIPAHFVTWCLITRKSQLDFITSVS